MHDQVKPDRSAVVPVRNDETALWRFTLRRRFVSGLRRHFQLVPPVARNVDTVARSESHLVDFAFF